jgi:hypothetical protein
VVALAELVAKQFLRDPSLKPLIPPLWTYLKRSAVRFGRLMTRVATNRLPKPCAPRPDRPKPDTPRPTNPIPTGRAWLIRALGYDAVHYASQLDHLLAEPGVADLLAACPAAARILRPLGRMLGLTALAPKRTAPKPRAPVATKTPRAVPPHRAPLPRLHPEDPSYRPSAKWPRGPWPTHRPRRAVPA